MRIFFFLFLFSCTKKVVHHEAKKARNIAKIDRMDFDLSFNEDSKVLIARLIGGDGVKRVKNAESLSALIDDYEAKYSTLSEEAKWIAAPLLSLKALRGVIYRIRPLITKSERGAYLHSFLVTSLRGIHGWSDVFLPHSSWEAGMDYIVRPYNQSAGNVVASITNEADLYKFIKDEWLPSLELLRNRIKSIASYTETKNFYFDNKLFYGMNVSTNQDTLRFVTIDKAITYSTLAQIDLLIASTQVSLSYSWKNLLSATSKIAKTYGFYGTLNNAGKVTSKVRVQTITENPNYDNLFKLRNDIGSNKSTLARKQMKQAYQNIVKARDHFDTAWEYLESKPDSDRKNLTLLPLTRSGFYTPFTNEIGLSLDNLRDLIDSNKQEISSTFIQNQKVQVKFKEFFHSPPEDLKRFLATGWISGKKELTDLNTKKQYRNYRFENPNEWNYSDYDKYFPETKTVEDVKKRARVLSQILGVGVLGTSMSLFLI